MVYQVTNNNINISFIPVPFIITLIYYVLYVLPNCTNLIALVQSTSNICSIKLVTQIIGNVIILITHVPIVTLLEINISNICYSVTQHK